jgi:hypothetical protein
LSAWKFLVASLPHCQQFGKAHCLIAGKIQRFGQIFKLRPLPYCWQVGNAAMRLAGNRRVKIWIDRRT